MKMDMRLAVMVGLLMLTGIGSCQGQFPFGNNWFRGLFDDINRMTHDIQVNVRQLQDQIQQDVAKHLKDVNASIAAINGSSTVIRNGNTIIVNGSGGTSRSILSGVSSDGTPYLHDVEERIIGNVLHRTVRVYDQTTKNVKEYNYTLDLTNATAKLEPVKDAN